MALTGCSRCIKYFSFMLDVLIALAGAVLLSFSLYVRFRKDSDAYLLDKDHYNNVFVFYYGLYGVAGIGALIMAAGVTGAIGVWKESVCTIITSIILMTVMILAKSGCAMGIYFIKDKVKDELHHGIRESVAEFSNSTGDTYKKSKDALEILQKGLKCCGCDGIGDYNNITDTELPEGCSGYENIGCCVELWEHVANLTWLFGYATIGLMVFELLSAVLGVAFAVGIKHSHETKISGKSQSDTSSGSGKGMRQHKHGVPKHGVPRHGAPGPNVNAPPAGKISVKSTPISAYKGSGASTPSSVGRTRL